MTFGNGGDCLFVGKGLPWTDFILNDMLRMAAGGVFEHYFYNGISQERLQMLEPRNFPQLSYINVPITLEQMLLIFFFWIVGMIMATFAFVGERASCS